MEDKTLVQNLVTPTVTGLKDCVCILHGRYHAPYYIHGSQHTLRVQCFLQCVCDSNHDSIYINAVAEQANTCKLQSKTLTGIQKLCAYPYY